MPLASSSPETRSPLEPDPSLPGPSSRHVQALDGLRGVAILLVMLFHCSLRTGGQIQGSNVVTGVFLSGWLGVDVFFVLSGFLITGILLDTKNTPRFFLNFYARRILRIVPVYYLVLFVTLVVLPLFVSYASPALRLMVDRQVWLWLHLTNVGFIYHHKAWLLSPWLDLSHLWSLAVEEQFYLVWPLLVWLCSRRRLVMLCIIGIVVPPVVRLALWHAGATSGAMYFATPCRVDGLALGALVAVVVRQGRFAIGPAFVRAALATGCVALGVLWWARGGLWFADKAAIAFAPVLVNIVTAAAILAVVKWPGLGRNVLQNAALRFSGRYSYGLYLFHPLIAAPLGILLFDAGVLGDPRTYVAALTFSSLVFFLSFALAVLSFHGFEKRWLSLKTRFHAAPLRSSS